MNPHEAEPTTQKRPRRVLRILCADDNPQMLKLLSELLGKRGHAVSTADDGKAALIAIVSDIYGYDLLITDHDMPRMNGLTLVRHLRQAEFPGRIVVLTGSASPKTIDAYKAFRMDAVFPKAARYNSLLQFVDELSSQSNRSA